METKNIVIIALAVVVIALLGVMYFYPLQDDTVIGGDRDEHGCLGGAGYSWNSTEKECVREWSMEEDRYQVNDFASCADAGYAIGESYPRQCWTEGGRHFVELSVNEYFTEQMWMRGVENLDGAHPIEGFDPALYMGAYSGLTEEDFDGVQAIGGVWEYRMYNLKFVRDSDESITSADGTVNEEGMAELLENLKSRLGVEVTSKEDVDSLLDSLSGSSKYDGGLILMQNSETGEYSCFGCGKTMCIDPAPIMKTVQETDERYCDGDYNVVVEEGAGELLRFCPDEWIDDRMPGADYENEMGAPAFPSSYFIVDGERRELTEFDVDFVERYCDVEKQVVV